MDLGSGRWTKKNEKFRPCDQSLVSHGTCSYVCTYTNAVANGGILHLYLRDFYNIILKLKLYIASGSVPSSPQVENHGYVSGPQG